MTLQQLTYLVTVADCGNITEAAEKLFISQPSLSAAIHNLEKEMGVTAFIRSNKGVTVTRRRRGIIILCEDAFRAVWSLAYYQWYREHLCAWCSCMNRGSRISERQKRRHL